MNTNIKIILILFILSISCSHDSNEDRSEKLYDFLAAKLNADSIIISNFDYLLFIPENSCKGCKKFIFENLTELIKNPKLEIIYLEKSRDPRITDKEMIILDQNKYSDVEIFGITLFELNDTGIKKIKYLNPNNIKDATERLITNE